MNERIRQTKEETERKKGGNNERQNRYNEKENERGRKNHKNVN